MRILRSTLGVPFAAMTFLTSPAFSDSWNAVDDPSRFGGSLVYDVGALPLEGAPKLPISPSDYWSVAVDSINYRWGSENLSPSEKYAAVFGLDAQIVTDLVSKSRGVISGHSGGWSRGWAAWSMIESVPNAPITITGPKGGTVTFAPADVKALLSFVYDVGFDKLPIRRVGFRPEVDDEVVVAYMNAGTFHVLAANLLGRMERSFAVDRTYDYEVWNQPLVAFSVTNATNDGRLRRISPRRACEMSACEWPDVVLTGQVKSMTEKRFFEVETDFSYAVEHAVEDRVSPLDPSRKHTVHYHYILETDRNGKITGGTWITPPEQRPRSAWIVSQKPSADSGIGPITYGRISAIVGGTAGFEQAGSK